MAAPAAAAATKGGVWQGAAIQGGMGLVAPFINRIGQKKRERRALGYSKQLMDIQQQHQMALNRQGHDLSYDM